MVRVTERKFTPVTTQTDDLPLPEEEGGKNEVKRRKHEPFNVWSSERGVTVQVKANVCAMGRPWKGGESKAEFLVLWAVFDYSVNLVVGRLSFGKDMASRNNAH